MSIPTAVGTRIADLTISQRLAVASAALDVAKDAGVSITNLGVDSERIVLHVEVGRGIELAVHFGLDHYHAYRSSETAFPYTGVSSGDWGGSRLSVFDTTPEASARTAA